MLLIKEFLILYGTLLPLSLLNEHWLIEDGILNYHNHMDFLVFLMALFQESKICRLSSSYLINKG